MTINRQPKLRLGIVGCRRGTGFSTSVRAMSGRAELTAAYDPDRSTAERFARENGIDLVCESFAQLIDSVDAVVVASPQHHHAPQAIFALERGVHVLSEVPAAVSMTQAYSLLAAARTSRASYMLAENYCYIHSNVVVDAMTRNGVFGDIYYGESEYLHEMRSFHTTPTGERTWRYYWQVGRDGHSYPTHSLGPLLGWFGDRVSAVSCVGTGRHTDPEHDIQDTILLLARTSRGALLKLRLDLLSNRPELMSYYALQGTEGAYEAARTEVEQPRVYIRGRTAHNSWDPIEKYYDEFLPDRYRKPLPDGIGHWGGDLWTVVDFVAAIDTGERPRLDIYEALRMTLPGIVSEASIAQNGQWMAVPDPVTWTAGIGVEPSAEAPLA